MSTSYEQRLRALAAATPAAKAPPGMLEFGAAMELSRAAGNVLNDPTSGRPLAEVLQAAVDNLRANAVANAAGDTVFPCGGGAVAAALGLGLAEDATVVAVRIRSVSDAELSAAPLDRDLLEHLMVVGTLKGTTGTLMHATSTPEANVAAATNVRPLVEAASAAAEFWGEPAAAARLEARLAELGVARGERAAADL